MSSEQPEREWIDRAVYLEPRMFVVDIQEEFSPDDPWFPDDGSAARPPPALMDDQNR